MPTIREFYGILIGMYFDDHAPPHFHAVYGEFEAVIDINALSVARGTLPRRALELTLDWAELHQAELLVDWDLCAAKQPPKLIEPLR